MKTNAEATVAVQFNQGTTKGMGCFIPFVVPWVTFFSSRKWEAFIETNKNINIFEKKESKNTALGKVLKNGSSAKCLNLNKSSN